MICRIVFVHVSCRLLTKPQHVSLDRWFAARGEVSDQDGRPRDPERWRGQDNPEAVPAKWFIQLSKMCREHRHQGKMTSLLNEMKVESWHLQVYLKGRTCCFCFALTLWSVLLTVLNFVFCLCLFFSLPFSCFPPHFLVVICEQWLCPLLLYPQSRLESVKTPGHMFQSTIPLIIIQ